MQEWRCPFYPYHTQMPLSPAGKTGLYMQHLHNASPAAVAAAAGFGGGGGVSAFLLHFQAACRLPNSALAAPIAALVPVAQVAAVSCLGQGDGGVGDLGTLPLLRCHPMIITLGVCVSLTRRQTAPPSQDARPVGVDPMALLGEKGRRTDRLNHIALSGRLCIAVIVEPQTLPATAML
jgi:hypothetical protein